MKGGIKVPKLYLDLWGTMKANGLTQGELGKRIGLSRASLQQRMAGKICFKQPEMYAIAEVLGVPVEKLPILFPPKGKRINKSDSGVAIK